MSMIIMKIIVVPFKKTKMENNLKQPHEIEIRRSMVLHHDIYVSCLDKCYVKGSQESFLPEFLRTT